MESAIPCLFRTCVRARVTISEAHVLLLCCSLDREERNTRTVHSSKKSGRGRTGWLRKFTKRLLPCLVLCKSKSIEIMEICIRMINQSI